VRATISARLTNVPEELDLIGPIYTGGEGTIYFSADGRYAAKVYHQTDPQKGKILQQVMELGKGLGNQARFLAWPLGIIGTFDGQARIGCVTHLIPSRYVEILDLMFSPQVAIAHFKQGRHWGHYLTIARELAVAVRILHGKGCAHADIQYRNFKADPTTGRTVLLDLDGIVVEGFLAPQVAGLPGFMAPEVVAGRSRPSESTDRHSTAVLILYTLLFRNPLMSLPCYDADAQRDDVIGWGEQAMFSEHSSDTRNRPPNLAQPLYRRGALSFRMLPPALQRLTERALVDGLQAPERRPQVWEWETALATTHEQLTHCHYCKQVYPYAFWVQPKSARGCPFCGTPARPPFPAVVELLDPGAKGLYTPSRKAILGPGFQVFSDFLEPTRAPAISREGQTPVGRVEWIAELGILALRNEDTAVWTAIAPGNRGLVTVRRDQRVPLQPGLQIHFGSGARLIRVVE